MNHALFLSIVATCVLAASNALAAEWPQLSPKASRPECTDALRMATSVFQSEAPVVYAPPVPVGEDRYRLVLWSEGVDISGGDAIRVDVAAFEKRPNPGNNFKSLYWQRQPESGYRIAVAETGRGWSGDTYTVSAVPADMTVEQATRSLAPEAPRGLLGGWRPPRVFLSDRSTIWLIDVGEPYDVLGDWAVYGIGPQGLEVLCNFEFKPPAATAISILPPAVRTLDRLLLRTLGSGQNEGTAQPTAAIRLNVEHTWGNMARRPWALARPHNTRAEVEAGLEEWSRTGKENKRLLRDIQAHYEPAHER